MSAFAKAWKASQDARNHLGEKVREFVREHQKFPTELHLSAQDYKLFVAVVGSEPIERAFGYKVASKDAEETYVE